MMIMIIIFFFTSGAPEKVRSRVRLDSSATSSSEDEDDDEGSATEDKKSASVSRKPKRQYKSKRKATWADDVLPCKIFLLCSLQYILNMFPVRYSCNAIHNFSPVRINLVVETKW